jgi:hypothetical protein
LFSLAALLRAAARSCRLFSVSPSGCGPAAQAASRPLRHVEKRPHASGMARDFMKWE